jgi:predicted nucleotidyltransferase
LYIKPYGRVETMKLKHYLDFVGNKKIWDILRLYYETRSQYSGSDVARILKANKMTTIKLMNHLAEVGILDKDRIGNIYSYGLKKNYITEKVVLPLLKEEANLINRIKEDIYECVKDHIVVAYIFGSYATGEETLHSDLDICFIVKKNKHIVEEIIERKIEEYIDYYNVKLSPYIVTKKEFDAKKDTKLIRNILREGVNINDG